MNKYTIRILTGLFFLLFLLSCSVREIDKTASVKAPADPEPGDCAACHVDKGVLPQGHVNTSKMTVNDCDSCHRPGPASLRTKIPLSHKHKLEGLSCKECHEDPASATAVDSKVCQGCHNDTGALIEAAKKLPINPHFSPHEGKISDCNKCHHQHKKSENVCANCHGMEYMVP